ncbi:MAG: hypothetical protein CW694_06225 [Candidatus Syntrophoarchaeum sp. WYZ-LMO15]|nr:MAG: hypothetical protein CW694_06225 [Candidatus Syntrophoarchaeum sp. WYZ-LMO15]
MSPASSSRSSSPSPSVSFAKGSVTNPSSPSRSARLSILSSSTSRSIGFALRSYSSMFDNPSSL